MSLKRQALALDGMARRIVATVMVIAERRRISEFAGLVLGTQTARGLLAISFKLVIVGHAPALFTTVAQEENA